ncbi:UDP-glucose dehydrogenase family protein [Taklimakanibacter lacteus]|uniref:UDP-glucose dehydrogenase family protein n=1 Tax=Taklimakanibacter lacteus TaxID=2268456 RepID=UPI000E6701EF
MKIAVIGAGYVGLVSGACLAEFGFDVFCVDQDARRVNDLNAGRMPIHEAGLDTLVHANQRAGRLHFTGDLKSAVAGAEAVFIAVSTPTRRGDDAADLAYVQQAADQIAAALDGYSVIITKSTVPVGTARMLKARIKAARPDVEFDMAANPEFLREGSAVDDFLRPDRIVVGSESKRAQETLRKIYQPITVTGAPLLFTDFESAELIKYAANGYLAMRLAFINQLADLCEKVGGDIAVVAQGIGHDKRIGHHYLHPGPGFGGSCFPKDSRALAATAREAGSPFSLIEAVVGANDKRKAGLFDRVQRMLGGSLAGKRIAVLGLAFKADTDDLRDAPALDLVPALTSAKASVVAFDPVVKANGTPAFAGIDWAQNAYEAAEGADAVIVLTEWNEFRGLDLAKLAGVMKAPVMIDLRNLYSTADIARTPFTYHSIGRKVVKAITP